MPPESSSSFPAPPTAGKAAANATSATLLPAAQQAQSASATTSVSSFPGSIAQPKRPGTENAPYTGPFTPDMLFPAGQGSSFSASFPRASTPSAQTCGASSSFTAAQARISDQKCSTSAIARASTASAAHVQHSQHAQALSQPKNSSFPQPVRGNTPSTSVGKSASSTPRPSFPYHQGRPNVPPTLRPSSSQASSFKPVSDTSAIATHASASKPGSSRPTPSSSTLMTPAPPTLVQQSTGTGPPSSFNGASIITAERGSSFQNGLEHSTKGHQGPPSSSQQIASNPPAMSPGEATSAITGGRSPPEPAASSRAMSKQSAGGQPGSTASTQQSSITQPLSSFGGAAIITRSAIPYEKTAEQSPAGERSNEETFQKSPSGQRPSSFGGAAIMPSQGDSFKSTTQQLTIQKQARAQEDPESSLSSDLELANTTAPDTEPPAVESSVDARKGRSRAWTEQERDALRTILTNTPDRLQAVKKFLETYPNTDRTQQAVSAQVYHIRDQQRAARQQQGGQQPTRAASAAPVSTKRRKFGEGGECENEEYDDFDEEGDGEFNTSRVAHPGNASAAQQMVVNTGRQSLNSIAAAIDSATPGTHLGPPRGAFFPTVGTTQQSNETFPRERSGSVDSPAERRRKRRERGGRRRMDVGVGVVAAGAAAMSADSRQVAGTSNGAPSTEDDHEDEDDASKPSAPTLRVKYTPTHVEVADFPEGASLTIEAAPRRIVIDWPTARASNSPQAE